MTIAGNITADPELRYTKANKPVTSFTVAMTPSTYDQATKKFVDGEALFMRVTVWQDMAEHVAHSLKKGDRVMVHGQVKQRSYQDREGNTKTAIEIVADEVGASLKFANASPVKGGHTQAQPQTQDNDGWVTVDDDTPF